MPALIALVPAALSWLIKFAVIAAIVRVVIALGIFFVTYNFVLPEVIGYISAQASGLPLAVIQVFGILHIDTFMTMILSAYVTRMGYQFTFGRFLPGGG